ncbi:MAG: peptide chain release factor 2 [Acidimicrobiales bacterium]
MRDLSEELAGLRQRLDAAAQTLNVEQSRAAVAGLEAQAADPGLWADPEAGRQVTTDLARARADVDLLDGLRRRLADAADLHDLAQEEADDSLAGEIDAALAEVGGRLEDLEVRSLFSGEHDERDAVCEVHSGAGGTDAQDWAEMLLGMYQRWAERKGFKVEVQDVAAGAEAGISSATFIIRGRFAYGMLSAEKGVHRLVRISPFDSQGRRHTAFASFDAVPYLGEEVTEVEIDEKDLRIDTYRSSGAGGQHVNVTDSAVRITHEPTGVVVSCQNQRSQHQNKAVAMAILGARLAERARQDRRRELDALSGEQRDVTWGSQIRSYVLAPYQLVKDLRTDQETGNVSGVLGGDLDAFITAFLHWRLRESAVGAGPAPAGAARGRS